VLRVAKPLQNGKIGLIFNEKGLKNVTGTEPVMCKNFTT
jgi:hypothetical protein